MFQWRHTVYFEEEQHIECDFTTFFFFLTWHSYEIWFVFSGKMKKKKKKQYQ